MKISLFAAAGAVMALAALPAAAQSLQAPSFYGTAGYAFIDGGEAANFGALEARLGARLHPNFGVEAEGAIGVDGDSENVGGVLVKSDLKHSLAAYAVGFLPVAPNFDVFVRGGFGTTKVGVKGAGVKVSASEESWNYGLGGQFAFDDKNGVRADYTRYDFNHGGGDADVWAISYVRKF